MDKHALSSKKSFMLSLAALGVVFGDIGTSPLYAFKQTLLGLVVNETDVLGVLSLFFWSLILTISLKYLVLVLRADNNGEGGILALYALLKKHKPKKERLFYFFGIFGAGLLLGDGMLTPAISVTSAIEGLAIFSPGLHELVLPIACTIMVFLFLMQAQGTAKIGAAFGPILAIWFLTIASIGVFNILQAPFVIHAINPYWAIQFFINNGHNAYLAMGGVFLVVTGGEALYADIGHFGRFPIRLSWFGLVLPCLLLNYFGQGAFLLNHPEGIENPFYLMSPQWFFPFLLVIATLATIIASQAVITATFSLIKQAVLLGFYPRIRITPTSHEHICQIFIPQMNFILLIGTISLILIFKSSSGLAHAYGMAVNLDMLLVSILVTFAAISVWKWSILKSISIFSIFILIELAFLGSNLHKFLTGGYLPIVFAILVTFLMHTWSMGMQYLYRHFYSKDDDLSQIIRTFQHKSVNRLKDVSAIFITDVYDKTGAHFLQFLKLSHAVPENVLIINHIIEDIPHVTLDHKFEVISLDKTFCQITLHYGFMDVISIPYALNQAVAIGILPFDFHLAQATYMVEIPNIIASKKKKSLWFYWQEKLFAFLVRNSASNLNIEFYQLPFNKTIAIGTYYIL